MDKNGMENKNGKVGLTGEVSSIFTGNAETGITFFWDHKNVAGRSQFAQMSPTLTRTHWLL